MFSARAGKPSQDGKRTCDVIRLPDKPSVSDLEALGHGNETMDETKNGLIVLDELAAWLNAREWGDKGRMAVIDWLLHSRKHGWDVMFISQHIEQIDKQIRTSLVEYLVVCRRMDRMKIPFFGKLLNAITSGIITGNMPQIHVATVRYGVNPDAVVSDRWIYQGKDLYDAYNTRQIFSERHSPGLHTVLPPWYTHGRYEQAKQKNELWRWLYLFPMACAIAPIVALQTLTESNRQHAVR